MVSRQCRRSIREQGREGSARRRRQAQLALRKLCYAQGETFLDLLGSSS